MEWRNRIIGEGEESPADLMPNPLNWRKHPNEQADALEAALERVGWVQRVIVNKRTGRLIDGHLRVELAKRRGEEKVPVLYVDLDEDEEALILATLDPLSSLAEADTDQLADLLSTLEGDDQIADLIGTVADHYGIELSQVSKDEGESPYTSAALNPIYEPRGESYKPRDLYDDSKALQLAQRVTELEDIDEDLAAFLIAATSRFIEFRYDRIAEYYASAPPHIQRIMEELALVIVDFDQAIERGFLSLNESLLDQYREEHGDS